MEKRASKELSALCLVAALVLVVALCGFAELAAAAEVNIWGSQTTLSQSDAQRAETKIDVLNLSGAQGDVVYLTVMDGTEPIVQYLPHQLGESGAAGDSVADTFSIVLPQGVDESKLANGSYTVQAYEQRGSDPLFNGTVYGVWAKLGDSDSEAKTMLIGTRTAGSSFAFTSPSTIYDGEQAYSLASKDPEMDGELAYYQYEPYDEAASVDATVSYVDEEGSLLRTETISGVPQDGSKQLQIPATIDANGKMYRTLSRGSVEAVNPGQTSFVVQCVYMRGASYLATIIMEDAGGNVIARDTVNVDDTFSYVAPSTIYRDEEVNGETRAVAYEIVDDDTYQLDATADMPLVVNGERVIRVRYEKQPVDAGQVKVTFNQIDANSNRQLLGTDEKTVTKQNPTTVPPEQVQANGVTYAIQQSAQDYAYSYGSGKTPVVDVYYVAEGAEQLEPYVVTVNYVDYATGQTISSERYDSSADQAALTLDAPETLNQDATNYVRLNGQANSIEHNFYSGINTYTVYYRDRASSLSNDTVVTSTRVVYRQQPTAATAPAVTAVTTPVSAIAPVSLNPTNTYSSVGTPGDANGGTLLNNEGVDSNAERIDENDNPLTQADEAETVAANEQESSESAGKRWLPLILLLVLAAILGVLAWWLFAARRKREGGQGASADVQATAGVNASISANQADQTAADAYGAHAAAAGAAPDAAAEALQEDGSRMPSWYYDDANAQHADNELGAQLADDESIDEA